MAAGPALGRRCVLFIDDGASCQPVHGYIRMPLELCRHWLSYESMFECQTASKIEFVDMVGLHWGVLVTGTQSNFINLHCNWWWQLVTLSRSNTRSTRV